MSGHSKWATIKRKKATLDAKRGKMFTKVLREIQVAARLGGGSPDGNPRLKKAISDAKAVSMPNDNIDRAIKRGTGDIEGVQYEETVYEGYGPGGVACFVKATTDNKNRTASEVRNIFTKAGGSLAGANAVAYLFSEKGQISVKKSAVKEDALFEAALDAGAEDVSAEEDSWFVTTSAADFQKVRNALEKLTQEIEAELQLVPANTVKLTGEAAASTVRMINALEEHEDVQTVATNLDIDEAELEKINSAL